MRIFYVLPILFFSFTQLSAQEHKTLKGKIYNDCPTKNLIQNVQIHLYQVNDDGEKELYSIISKDGHYSFDMKSNLDYRIELEHTEYRTTSSYIKIANAKELTKNITMKSKRSKNCATPTKEKVVIKGKVFDNKKPEKSIKNAVLSLFEVEGLKEYAINAKVFEDGNYSFKLDDNKHYRIQVEVKGYETISFHTTTKSYEQSTIIWDLPIESSNLIIIDNVSEVVLKGNVFNAVQPSDLLENVDVVIYEIQENGVLQLFKKASITENFYFVLKPFGRYKFVLEHKDFQNQSILIDTHLKYKEKQIDMDFYMFPN